MILIICLSFLYIGCAKIVPLGGGEKDVLPPKVVEIVPSNYSTNFNSQEIWIEFDEYVKISDPSKITISPFQKEPPEFKIKKKGVQITFKEELKKDITYTIDFGENIVDINESNKLTNFQYVFSTGAVIDSLSFSGNLMNAADNELLEEAVIAVYKGNSDSLFTSAPPLYIAKTNKTGQFSINNMASGVYKVYALSDENGNYYYDQPTEAIAFMDSSISLPDTSNTPIELRLFQTESTPIVESQKNMEYGHDQIILSDKDWPISFKVIDSADYVKAHLNPRADTLNIWYKADSIYNFSVILSVDNQLIDTISIKGNNKSKELKPLSYKTNLKEGKNKTKSPISNLVYTFSYPVSSFDTQAVKLWQDSTQVELDGVYERSEYPRQLVFAYNWESEKTYRLEIEANAYQDIFGRTNDSLIVEQFTITKAEEFGSMSINLLNPKTGTTYFYELQNASKKRLQKAPIADTAQIKGLDAGDYYLLIIEDTNVNYRWDSGSFEEQRQAERVFSSGQKIKIKKNWESEQLIDVQ